MTPIKSGAGWEWLKVFQDGDDIKCPTTIATAFGYVHDPMDSSGVGVATASGFRLDQHPEYMGVSLPQMRGLVQMRGCPIPKLPWYIPVKVYLPSTGKAVYAHLIDLGPARDTHHGIDLTPATLRALGYQDDPDGFSQTATFRIIGGAKYLP